LQGFINGIRLAKSELSKVYAKKGDDLRKELRDRWNDIEIERMEIEELKGE
jgi:hypothetical protein